ncbi:helix-turn-helix domain-containing protein [Phytomonospora endophytica]|uniref:Transcriptional regulator with XRE-family HTH domain n=1 Tax=Phytomonospora endophytica TaxID=714109 RepID=A0A841FU09_9ACTN|nr:helix-turn-helix transcriptional regulator [Phytomonospora endophytica]MBB6037032.1 transcriptional regulator with XRE-family HTH domain [Phytomonospora endophytica]GIG69424.1 transcriptional regulator [Phytomonospora endophytica]
MAKNEALSLRAQWLGNRLRAARTAAGFKLVDVAEYTGLADATLSRFELGTLRIRKSYIRDLIDFYGVRAEDRAVLLQLNEDSWRRDWWDGDAADLDVGFIDYTWLEARAAGIRQYDPILINGLLQTPDYARAVSAAGLGNDMATLDRMVELRMTRQRIFDRETPTFLSIVLEEAPLRREIGSPDTHRDQLVNLIELARRDYLDIRIITTEAGWHRGWPGPFTLFELPDPHPDVVYIEGLVGRTFLEDQAKVQAYQHAYDELHAAALPPKKSVAYIESVLEGLT